jgi:hypothetical protein
MLRLLLALQPLVSAASTGADRDVVSFNKGWRFHRGDPTNAAPYCPPTAFPHRLTNVSCTDSTLAALSFAPLHSPLGCRKACCSGIYLRGSCTAWLFLARTTGGNAAALQSGCYLLTGAVTLTCTAAGTGGPWSGGSTVAPGPPGPPTPVPAPPPSHYEYSADTFDDSGWESVDVPHDFVLRGAFVPNELDAMHGYLPREAPGWYRKSFRVPVDWRGSTIVLEFDGVFHISRLWLNGAELTVAEARAGEQGVGGGSGHRNGYTDFRLRLDAHGGAAGAGSLRYGTGPANHLALRADASFGSGHWYEGETARRRAGRRGLPSWAPACP